MKAIKWIGGIQFHSIGALIPGRIVTEDEISIDVMISWVAQGVAEWYEGPAIIEPVKEVLKKRKIKEVSHG